MRFGSGVWALAFLSLFGGLAAPAGPTTPVAAIEVRQQMALNDARDWLLDQPASIPALEALHVAGVKPDFELPGKQDYGREDLRLLHAIVAAGNSPLTVGPSGQAVNFLQILASLYEPVVGEGKIARIAWLVLALHAAGAQPDDNRVSAAADLILANQGPRGDFACNTDDRSGDCAGFAAAALQAAGKYAHCGSLLEFWRTGYNDDGSFTPPDSYTPFANANTQAWALISFEACSEPAPAAAWDWLLGLQTSDGSFAHSYSQTGSGQLYPTADAALALAGFPGPAWAPAVIEHERAPSGKHVLRISGNFTGATWTVNGIDHAGFQIELDLPAESHQVSVYATGNGTHHRAELTIWVHPDAGVPFTPFWLLAVGLLAATWRRSSRGQ
jgi:hypothetical protein